MATVIPYTPTGVIGKVLFNFDAFSAAASPYDLGGTARVSALAGATSGGVQGETDQRDVIRRCIAGRGDTVLQ